MKFAITSPVLDFLGNKLVGTASALFGLPPGALSDLYSMHYDRPAPRPEDPDNPEWMRRRVFEINVRHQLSLRVGKLGSILSMVVVIAGLFILGGVAGVKHAWSNHEMTVGMEKAQAAIQATSQGQAAPYQTQTKPGQDQTTAPQLTLEIQMGVNAETDNCQSLHASLSSGQALSLVAGGGLSLSLTPTKAEATRWATRVGCDLGTGKIDVAQAAAAAQLQSACQDAQQEVLMGRKPKNVPAGCDINTGNLK